MSKNDDAGKRPARSKRRNRRSSYSPGQLRACKGSYISADLLVKHLTGYATAPGASADAGTSCAGAGADLVAPAKAAAPGQMVLLIGLPASGKSSISAAFEKAGWVRINKDALRLELYVDESTLGVPREISALFYKRLEEALKNGRNVLIDNTNISPLHRKGPIAMAGDYGYTRVTHVLLDVPLQECLRRNRLRARQVPEAALIEMAEALTWKGGVPSRREGHLVVLKPGRAVGEFFVDRVRMHGPRRIKNR